MDFSIDFAVTIDIAVTIDDVVHFTVGIVSIFFTWKIQIYFTVLGIFPQNS